MRFTMLFRSVCIFPVFFISMISSISFAFEVGIAENPRIVAQPRQIGARVEDQTELFAVFHSQKFDSTHLYENPFGNKHFPSSTPLTQESYNFPTEKLPEFVRKRVQDHSPDSWVGLAAAFLDLDRAMCTRGYAEDNYYENISTSVGAVLVTPTDVAFSWVGDTALIWGFKSGRAEVLEPVDYSTSNPRTLGDCQNKNTHPNGPSLYSKKSSFVELLTEKWNVSPVPEVVRTNRADLAFVVLASQTIVGKGALSIKDVRKIVEENLIKRVSPQEIADQLVNAQSMSGPKTAVVIVF